MIVRGLFATLSIAALASASVIPIRARLFCRQAHDAGGWKQMLKG
jgi:hypothetical protein